MDNDTADAFLHVLWAGKVEYSLRLLRAASREKRGCCWCGPRLARARTNSDLEQRHLRVLLVASPCDSSNEYHYTRAFLDTHFVPQPSLSVSRTQHVNDPPVATYGHSTTP